MPKPNQHIALPLEWLFARLQASRFAINTARKLRLLKLLDQEGANYIGRMDELKYLLAPYVARNAEEQQLFYTIFDQFREDCAIELQTLQDIPPPIEPEPSFQSRYRWLVFPLLLILASPWIIDLLTPTQPIVVQIDKLATQQQFPYREGETLVILNQTVVADTSGFTWEIRDAATGRLEYIDSLIFNRLEWVIRGYGRSKLLILKAPAGKGQVFQPAADTLSLPAEALLCGNPPPVLDGEPNFPPSTLLQGQMYDFSVTTEEDTEIEWIFSNGDTILAPQFAKAFYEENTLHLRLRLYRPNDKRDCFNEFNESFVINSGRPYMQMESLKPDAPQMALKLSPSFWLLTLLPLIPAIFLFLRWYDRRRWKPRLKSTAELEREYPLHDRAPYFIPYAPQDDKINVPSAFFRIANLMRNREEGLRREFDSDKSVRAVAASGGYPSWVDAPLTRPAEYLILIRRTDERQQQDRLFYRLVAFLKSQDASVTTFFHDGRFDRFRNERFPGGLPLSQVYRRYPEHRLIIIGNAHDLVNPHTTHVPSLLRAPLQDLERWPRRLVITPEPVADWSYQEGLLYRHFRLFPADTQGIVSGLEALDIDEDYQPGSFSQWKATLSGKHPEPSYRYRVWDQISEHRDYLADDEVFRWLCALAVSPQPDWALTIAIGRALDIDVTHDRLLRLSRIPWLADNAPNNDLRLALLQNLSPEDEQMARQTFAEELEKVRAQTQGSFAESDWKSNLAVQYFALDPRNKRHKQMIRDLQQVGLLSADQLSELDFIVKKRIEQQGLPGKYFTSLNTWLEAATPKRRFAEELGLFGLLFLTSLSGLLGGWNYGGQEQLAADANDAGWWKHTVQLVDEAFYAHQRAVTIGQTLDTITSWQEWQAAGDSTILADSLFIQAVALRGPQGYPLADSNRLSYHINLGTRVFNFYLADSLSTPDDKNVLEKDTISLRTAAEAFLTASLMPGNQDDRHQKALHGRALCLYYLSREEDNPSLLDSSVFIYRQLLDLSNRLFFNKIKAEMPVNLETLLLNSTAADTVRAIRLGNSIKTVNNPVIESRPDNEGIELLMIEITQDSTVVMLRLEGNSSYNLSAPSTENAFYLRDAVGNKYDLIGIQDIDFGSELYTREPITFSLFFEAIPETLATIDLVEGDNQLPIATRWNFLGIDLSTSTVRQDPLQVDKRSGYQTQIFGNKEWLTENLRLFVPGTECYGSGVDCVKFGLLYTWEEAQKACSELGAGWRLPTDQEWLELIQQYGGYYDWHSDRTIGSPRDAYRQLMTGGSSGFNAQLGGFLMNDGTAYDIDINGNYWTSSDSTGTRAWNINFNAEGNGGVTRVVNRKNWAFSCRCVRDAAFLPATVEVRGRVLDQQTARPIAGATVRFANDDTTTIERLRDGSSADILSTTTNSEGEFQLDSISKLAPLKLVVVAGGYGSETVQIGPDDIDNAISDLFLRPNEDNAWSPEDILNLSNKILVFFILIPIIVAIRQRKIWNTAIKVIFYFCLLIFLINLMERALIWLANNRYDWIRPFLEWARIENTYFISILYDITAYFLLSRFFSLTFPIHKARPMIKWLGWLLIVMATVNYFFIEGYRNFSAFNLTMKSTFIAALSILYLWSFRRYPIRPPFRKNPYTWFSLGLLISSLTEIFFQIAGGYFGYSFGSDLTNFYVIYIIRNILEIIGWLLISVGFLYTGYLPMTAADKV